MTYGKSWTFDTPQTERISRNLGIMTGSIAFNNYSSANNASDQLCDYFLDTYRVVFDGPTSTGGYTPRWNRSSGCVDLYHIDDVVPNLASGPDTILPVAVSGGNVGFVAFGLWR